MEPMTKAISAASRIDSIGTMNRYRNRDAASLILLAASTCFDNFGACNASLTNCYEIFWAGIIWAAACALGDLRGNGY